MAAGDAHRVWFPEMVECLRSHWHQGISLDVMVELRDDLDAMLQRIRSERRIRSVFKCSRCGYEIHGRKQGEHEPDQVAGDNGENGNGDEDEPTRDQVDSWQRRRDLK